MSFLKKTGIVVLTLACLAVIAYFGMFILDVAFPAQPQLQEPDTQELMEYLQVRNAPTEEATEELTEELTEPEETTDTEQEQPVEEVPVLLDDQAAQEKAKAYLADMTEEEKIWQLFFTTPDDLTGVSGATQAGDMTKKALEKMPVGGLCYFTANLEDPEQVTALLSGTQQMVRTPVFLSVDEEGGMVSRLGSVEGMGVTKLASANDFGTAGNEAAVYAAGGMLAQEMRQLGFNMNFAPVADLWVSGNTEIGSRAYSADPQVVAQMASAMATGLQDGGIAACLKHFPGHGYTTVDSHEGKSLCNRTMEQLQQEEFPCFRTGIENGVCFVMMSHLTNENLSENPASLSPEVVSLLRNELGFEGVIITDSLKMGAIVDAFSADDAAVKALSAGCDMLLMPNSPEKAHDGIVQALEDGTLTWERIDQSVMRILTVKYKMGIMQ